MLYLTIRNQPTSSSDMSDALFLYQAYNYWLEIILQYPPPPTTTTLPALTRLGLQKMKGLLPDKPMLRISSFPDAFSLLLVSQVNKCQNKVAKSDQLWRNLCLRKQSFCIFSSQRLGAQTQQYSSDKAGVLDDAGTVRRFCLQRNNWEPQNRQRVP